MNQVEPKMMASRLRRPAGYVPCETVPGQSHQRLVLLCDHARNSLPEDYGTLGLPASELDRHIAYDIGTEALVRGLAADLEAPAVISNFSRLLIDPNRGIDDPTLIMRLSDGAVVPGNAHIDQAERQHRIETFYKPYHRAVDAVLDERLSAGVTPLIISVHSFTETWKGVPRPWQAGILWEPGWSSLSDRVLTALRRDPTLVVGDNEPYRGGLEGDTLRKHGVGRNLPHVLIEVRQDLICDLKGIKEWRSRLAGVLMQVADQHP